MHFKQLLGLCLALAIPTTALASNDEAWGEFRVAVAQACRAQVEAIGEDQLVIEVEPYGTESYGVALVTRGHADGSAERMICVFDKTMQKSELSGDF